MRGLFPVEARSQRSGVAGLVTQIRHDSHSTYKSKLPWAVFHNRSKTSNINLLMDEETFGMSATAHAAGGEVQSRPASPFRKCPQTYLDTLEENPIPRHYPVFGRKCHGVLRDANHTHRCGFMALAVDADCTGKVRSTSPPKDAA